MRKSSSPDTRDQDAWPASSATVQQQAVPASATIDSGLSPGLDLVLSRFLLADDGTNGVLGM